MNFSFEQTNTHGTTAEGKAPALKPIYKTIIFFAVIHVIVSALAVVYIKMGKQIYFWDNATYWDISRKIASGSMGTGGFWRSVYNSIAEQDYNYVAALPSAFLMLIFGETRLVYVLGLVNMYLMPSYIMIYHLAKKLTKTPKIAAAVTMLLMPAMAFLAFAGFADIGALPMCLMCYYLYYKKDGTEGAPWRYVIIGALLVLVMIWRRYYAFFAVSFITAMIADCVLFKRKWYNAAIAIATAGAILLLFFRGFVFNRLMADYGTLYSAYKFSVSTDFKLITRYFGLIFLTALIAASIAAAVKKKERRTVFMWLQIIACLFMFISTQTHGQQHLLLYMPSLIMLTLILFNYISKRWLLISVAALSLAHSVSVYIPRTQPTNIQDIKYAALVPNFSMLPQKRADSEEILALKQRLDSEIPEGNKLGVLASSFTLNEDILKNVEPSLGIKPARSNYIISLPQVDSRDKDLTALYTTDYILTASPAQTHLAGGSQTVITEAVRSFEDCTDIATAYEEIESFRSEVSGMTLRLYRRTRGEYQKDINAFEARLYK